MWQRLLGGSFVYVVIVLSGTLTAMVRYEDSFAHAFPDIALCAVLPMLILSIGVGVNTRRHRRIVRTLQTLFVLAVLGAYTLVFFHRYPFVEMVLGLVATLICTPMIGTVNASQPRQPPHTATDSNGVVGDRPAA